MIIRHAPLICDECSDEIVETFHAILGGKIFRLCSESCRTVCRTKHLRSRFAVVAEPGRDLAIREDAVPQMPCGAYGDEWG